MTPRSLRLSGLFAVLLVCACDGGSDAKPAPGKAKAAASKAAPAKVAPAKAAPTKAAPTKVADAKTPTTPTAPAGTPAAGTPAAGTPAAGTPAEATPTPAEPTPAAEPTPTEPTPTEVVPPPTEPEPAAAEPTPEPTPPMGGGATATGTGAEMTTAIPLGTDAEILKLVLAHDVVKRVPIDPSTTFPEGQKVSLFIESRNESGEPIFVRVTWENVDTGRRSPPVGVKIGARKLHRTRAYRTMRKAGSYKAIVLGEEDQELAVMPFTVE